MKLHTLIGLALLVLIGACEKDDITTKPKITFVSASTDFVPLDADLSFILEFSDKEGDLSSPIIVIKESSSCLDAGFEDSVTWAFPDIPGTKNTDGELEIKIDGMVKLNRFRCVPSPYAPDADTVETAIFKFVIKDDAGNYSDTAASIPITIAK